MDILKRLPGKCGTPVCMPAMWKMLKKRFLGKVIYCISAKRHILRYISLGALVFACKTVSLFQREKPFYLDNHKNKSAQKKYLKKFLVRPIRDLNP